MPAVTEPARRPGREDAEGRYCHIAENAPVVPGDPWATYCGRLVREGPCCMPDAGYPPCGRPQCPDCYAIYSELGFPHGPVTRRA